MPDTISLDLLDNIRVASPCSVRWDQLAPVSDDDRVRHCAQCGLNVHNISEMSREDASVLLLRHARSGERLCGRIYRRADGTVITRDCPVGLATIRRRVASFCSLGAAAILTAASGAMLRVARIGNHWHPAAQTLQPVGDAAEWLGTTARRLTGARSNRTFVMGSMSMPRMPPNVPRVAYPLYLKHTLDD